MARIKRAMRSATLALSLVLLAAAASAQNIRFGVFPSYGTVSGGDEVIIEVTGVACNDFRQNLDVRFDDVPAPFWGAASGDCRRIVAITPPHRPGAVTVSVRINDVRYTSNLGVFAFTGLGSTPMRENYEQILVPLPIPAADAEVPGANGARWVTEAFVYNGSTRYLELFHNLSICEIIVCHGTEPYPGFQPGMHRLPARDRASLWYVQKTRAEDATFTMQLYDRSRAQESSGSEVPVVREGDFRMNELTLPRVPVTSAGRTSLRVFLPEAVPFRVWIRIFRADDSTLIVERTVDTNGQLRPPSFPEQPAEFFIQDLRREFPQLTGGMYRIQLDVLHTLETPLWAMASIANDTTNLVTIISPQ